MPTSLLHLLQALEDPFSFFPMQSVSRSLQQLIESTDKDIAGTVGPYGVAREYWDVPSEILYEEIGLLIGAGFVLGQAMVTQTISIMNKVRELTAHSTLFPEGKVAKLEFHASKHVASGFSHPYIIDLAANYFKHHTEWPDHWACSGGGNLQIRTIQGCLAMGISPGEVTGNMLIMLHAFGNATNGIEAIQERIQLWRESLAKYLYLALGVSARI